jgi:hypothetical protein
MRTWEEKQAFSRALFIVIVCCSVLSRIGANHSSSPQDQHFTEKVRDIVGLYLNPPDKALVLHVDEESQIQALEHSKRILPMGI